MKTTKHNITCKNIRWVNNARRGAARRMVANHIRSFTRLFGNGGAFSFSETKKLMRQAYAAVGI